MIHFTNILFLLFCERTLDTETRIRNRFCQVMHKSVLHQTGMEHNCMVAYHTNRIFDVKIETTMPAIHLLKSVEINRKKYKKFWELTLMRNKYSNNIS